MLRVPEFFGRPFFVRMMLMLLCGGLCVTLCDTAVQAQTKKPAADDDDDDDLKKSPGLLASYSGPAARPGLPAVSFSRIEGTPAFLLGEKESPDPRLPSKGWSVVWTGVLEVKAPGKYTFSGRGTGTLEWKVNNKVVLHLKGNEPAGQLVTSAPVELKFGLQPIEIRFTPAGEGAQLKLSWQSETFGHEPLPAFALGHKPAPQPVVDHFFTGRLAVEEHNCAACHKPNSQLAPLSNLLSSRQGPRLTDAGGRLTTSWVYHWLGNPQATRPEAVMPRLFSDDRTGEIERLAVATFLTSRGKAPTPKNVKPEQIKGWANDGKNIFNNIGCAVCHEKHGDLPARATLQGLGHKTNAESLAAFIGNPDSVDPSGRMPHFTFTQGDDTYKVALYLMTKDDTKEAPVLPTSPTAAELRSAFIGVDPGFEFEKLANAPADKQLAELGRQVMKSKRCTNCHELNIPNEGNFWKPTPASKDFAAIAAAPQGGCLGPAEGKVSGDRAIPVYGSSLARDSAAEFLKSTLVAPATPAPGETARLTLARLNCLRCHQRNNEGGLAEALVAKLLVNQTEKNAESVAPPPLTGVVEKLRESALRGVLESNQRARPWMGLQMPRFARSHVEPLSRGLAALDGDVLQKDVFRPIPDPELIEGGRSLIGEKGFSCTKCHDMLGVASAGTRGPDLARMTDRVNYDWYRRWMTDPQRLQPGTRMPTVFFQGKSPYPHIATGDPEKQRLAMWQYLPLSPNLPHPEGLQQPKSLRFISEAPGLQVARTFLPDSSARAMAVRTPAGLHFAFDAQACRLTYAWTGEFLEMTPVWNGRGGNKAKVDGTIYWTSPAGFPWDVTPSADRLPDFSKRGSDTTLGAVPPQDGKLYPSRLNFRGYQVQPEKVSFKYELELDGDRTATFEESARAFRLKLANAVSRETTVNVPAGHFAWLNVGTSTQPPQWTTADNKTGVLDSSTGTVSPAAVIKLVQDNKTILVKNSITSNNLQWVATQQDGKWYVLLRHYAGTQPAPLPFSVTYTVPIDNDPTLIEKSLADLLQAK